MCVSVAEGRMDRVYIDAGHEESGPVVIHPGNQHYHLELIHRAGFRDLGLWNPHYDLPDPTMFEDFVAFSSGEIARPVRWARCSKGRSVFVLCPSSCGIQKCGSIPGLN